MPARGLKRIQVGDVNGTVRSWDLPLSTAWTVTRVPNLPLSSRFSPDGAILAVYGTNPVIRLIHIPDGSIIELHGHTGMIGGVRFSPDGRLAMSFSWDGTVKAWRVSDGTLLGTLDNHKAIVEDGDFVDNGTLTASVGDDGRIFVWNPMTGDARSLLTHRSPLTSLEVVPTTNEIVAQDITGAVWIVRSTGEVKELRRADNVEMVTMRVSKNGALLGLGREDGVTLVYRSSDWAIIKQLNTKGTVARIEFDPHGRDVLVYSEDGNVELAPLYGPPRASWRTMRVEAHDVAYSSDGEIVAISALDGGSWFYSMKHASWTYKADHSAEVWSGQFSPDGSHFASVDKDGFVVLRAMPIE
jgi:WD40 repeat protein